MKILYNDKMLDIKKGTCAFSLLSKEEQKNVYAFLFNGHLHDVSYCMMEDGKLQTIDPESDTGKKIYDRTLSMLFISAVKQLYPDCEVHVEHSLSNGYFCRMEGKEHLDEKCVQTIQKRMQDMVEHKCIIHKVSMPLQKAVTFFKETNKLDKAQLFEMRKRKNVNIYSLEGIDGYFYGILLPNTTYLTHFSLRLYEGGIWLSSQEVFKNQPKMFQVFQEFERWGRLIGASNVAQLNQKILHGDMQNMVLMSETMVEKKLAQVAEKMVQKEKIKFVLISGPSSAGKTTFSRRLAIHLKILGKNPVALSMDDFFKNREDTPKLADGSYDFECLEALDVPLLQTCLKKLLQKEEVQMPLFNFQKGKREWRKEPLCLEDNQILIIEGIHGLNPKITNALPADSVFKIYINALTHLNLDEHNPIPTKDYRLIRRIARDYQFRGWSAAQTIHLWENVVEGEEKYIYPYQEEADAVFNSSMIYELPILKTIVLPLLNEITVDQKEYLEAHRIEKLLSYFVEGESDAIPRHSILAEFIGNSVFDVY